MHPPEQVERRCRRAVIASLRMRRRVALLLPLVAVALGCGDDTLQGPEAERVLKTLDTVASEAVRTEVLRTCDKWKRLDDAPCVEADVRRDQFDCWLHEALPRLQGFKKQGTRPRARDRGTMRLQNLCMEQRGWRFVSPSGYF